MKKSLVALAVAGAFSGAAFAQSSVTLYGRVDVGIQKTNTGTSILSGSSGTAGEVNVVQGSGSRLGFQGKEDLGGGLNAIFQIEHRFNPDDGNVTAPAFWNGRSYVGLSGSFGTVKLGREYTPAFWVGLAADPWGYDTIGQMGTATLANSSALRFPNMINYKSPSFGGVTFEAAWVAHESIAATADYGLGANVMFSQGPIMLAYGYEDNVQTISATDTKLHVLTGSYKVGPAKLIANWAQGEDSPTSVKRTNYTLAGAFTVGAGEFRAGYSSLKTDIPSAPSSTRTKIGLGYHHSLSKRTTLYVDYGRASDTSLSSKNGFDFGVKHNF